MNNIILIGMPACGKSTLGVLLAKTLGMSFIDTDLLIQESEGELLQHIINTRGLQAFMDVEERVLSGVEAEHAVIATGGSAVYSDKAMQHLRSIGKVVYIRLPLEEIMVRLRNIKTRGVAMNPGQTLEDLYAQRTPLYEKYADITIDTSGRVLEESVSILTETLKENGFAAGR